MKLIASAAAAASAVGVVGTSPRVVHDDPALAPTPASSYATMELSTWTISSANASSPAIVGASVPTTVFAAAASAAPAWFPNPLYGVNLQAINPATFVGPAQVPWTFSTTVPAEPVARASLALLELDGISYRARAFADGVALSTLEDGAAEMVGVFRSFRLVVPSGVAAAALSEAEAAGQDASAANITLEVSVWPAVDEWRPPGNNSTDLAISFIDWNPPPPDASTGLWRPARLLTWPGASTNASSLASPSSPLSPLFASVVPQLRLEYPVASTSVTNANGSWAADVVLAVDVRDVTLSSGAAAATTVMINCTVSGPAGAMWSLSAAWTPPARPQKAGALAGVSSSLTTVEFPPLHLAGADLELWWPWHMLPASSTTHGSGVGGSRAFVYNFSCVASASAGALTTGDDDDLAVVVIDQVTASFGVRQVTSQMNAQGFLAMRINGKPMLVLGGGYTPRVDMRVRARPCCAGKHRGNRVGMEG